MTAAKRILFCSWYTGLGGGETDLLTLARSLDGGEFERQLLLPGTGALGQRWQAAGWRVHQLRYRGASTWFVPALWARFPVVRRLTALLQRERIDLVQSDYHTLPLIAPAARQLNLPLLWTAHGWWFQPKRWQRDFFRQLPAVARSRAIRDGFLGSPPFMPAEQLPIVYSGVDVRRFHPGLDRAKLRRELGFTAETKVVAMVARFQRVKGHHHFQAMARRILAQAPATQFIIAGDDAFGLSADKRYRAKMLKRARADAQLRQRLRYIGFRSDIESVYAAADVVVCPSEYESYGIANLEAMACGIPVVSTDAGGPAETIVDGETGYLVDSGDSEALARAALRLLADGELRARLGAAGRRRILTHFSPASAAAAYTRRYRELLRRDGVPR